MTLFKTLRENYNKLIYRNYIIEEHSNELTLIFYYELFKNNTLDTSFKHILTIEKKHIVQNSQNLENIIFHIGLIEAISYWKIAAPKKLVIDCGYLNSEQINWFKKLFVNGLGEYLYVNQIQIDLKELVEFEVSNKYQQFEVIKCETNDNNIIPIGGGKDSLVTYELLKEEFPQSYILSINPIEASKNVLLQHPENSISIRRKLDSQIFDFNTKGFLNGHIPFSSIVAFITVFVGLLYKVKYVVLSNEASANEENTVYNGLKINHQYSKSLEFENDFRKYVDKFITKDVEYFSFLRPLDELTIAKLFSQYKRHFSTFLSCNVGSKINKWCGKCPKCLFTFIMLCNFIDDEKLREIFGHNLLDDRELESIFNQLIHKDGLKPLECVGTYDEINYALQRKMSEYNDSTMPYLLKNYTLKSGIDYSFSINYEIDNNLPEVFKKILKQNVTELNK